MSSGGAARKFLSGRETAIAAMRSTIADFARQSEQWEREMESMFDDLESFATSFALESIGGTKDDPRARQELLELASKQQDFARKQEDASVELALLREVIEQQNVLLSALAGNATR